MRKPPEFYRDLAALRMRWGEREYGRDQIRPEVIMLLRKHRITEDALMQDCADQTLDNVEHAEDHPDPSQPELFAYEAQVALGNKRRIRRGKMNTEQHRRRKRVIDRNKRAQDAAWANETEWLDEGIDALEGHSIETTRDQVLTEDGKVLRVREPEPA